MTGCRFVGMTWCRFPCGWIRHSRAGGNLEFQCLKNLSEKNKTLPPSFPRKWESRNEKQRELIGNDRNRTDWIPAFAGMTATRLLL
ncbi:hypothetical protein COI20_02740 [Neisseria meningitidis]|nr:hypothetical protein COI20_02740 [Neisseria meningitidis]